MEQTTVEASVWVLWLLFMSCFFNGLHCIECKTATNKARVVPCAFVWSGFSSHHFKTTQFWLVVVTAAAAIWTSL